MIVRMRLGTKLVEANVDPSVLIFNGTEWVKPRVGDFATMIIPRHSIADEKVYPVNEQPASFGYKTKTDYLGKIVAVENATAQTAVPVVGVQAPPNDPCQLCLVCNQGIQLLNVQVTQL